ncbi:MAG: hypothetical protein PHN89_05345 [Candidatus Pacebacteria bacterium]|nr:hypothetical protein [Candidatus Paceibacterota bacterium]
MKEKFDESIHKGTQKSFVRKTAEENDELIKDTEEKTGLPGLLHEQATQEDQKRGQEIKERKKREEEEKERVQKEGEAKRQAEMKRYREMTRAGQERMTPEEAKMSERREDMEPIKFSKPPESIDVVALKRRMFSLANDFLRLKEDEERERNQRQKARGKEEETRKHAFRLSLPQLFDSGITGQDFEDLWKIIFKEIESDPEKGMMLEFAHGLQPSLGLEHGIRYDLKNHMRSYVGGRHKQGDGPWEKSENTTKDDTLFRELADLVGQCYILEFRDKAKKYKDLAEKFGKSFPQKGE